MQLPWIKKNTFLTPKACHRFALNNAAVKQGMSPEIARLDAHCTKPSWTLQFMNTTIIRNPHTQTPGTSMSTIFWNIENMDQQGKTRLQNLVYQTNSSTMAFAYKTQSIWIKKNTFSIRTACPYFPLNQATVKQGMWPEIARPDAHCTKSSWTLQFTDTITVWIPQSQNAWHEQLCYPLTLRKRDNEKARLQNLAYSTR